MKLKTDEYKTTRIWKKTHAKLKLLAALSQESLVELLDRLASEELQRAKNSVPTGDEHEKTV
jgi:hypothetical protein